MRPSRRAWLVALASTLVATSWAPCVAAATDDGPAASGTALPSGAAAVATELENLESQLVDNAHLSAAVQARLTQAALALDETAQQLTIVDEHLDQIRAQLREKAAVAYVRHQTIGLDQFSVTDRSDYASGSTYLSRAAALDGDTLSDLVRTQGQLQAAQGERTATRDELADRAAHLDAQRADLERRAHADDALLQKWGAVSVMGDAQLTGAQMAAWYRSTGARPVLAAGTTIDDITQMYVEEGAAEHVRGDLAFAQAIIETGGFEVAAGNNYSGIGVCDSCKGGNRFDSPRAGIRAQIQLLRNYADPSSRAANLRYPPEPGLYGHDVEAAGHSYDTFFLKGKAPLWNLMGHGNWATDPTYATKVIDTYVQMVLYANAHPS